MNLRRHESALWSFATKESMDAVTFVDPTPALGGVGGSSPSSSLKFAPSSSSGQQSGPRSSVGAAAPHAQVKSEAEILFPQRMGGNEHSRIYYMGIYCRDNP